MTLQVGDNLVRAAREVEPTCAPQAIREQVRDLLVAHGHPADVQRVEARRAAERPVTRGAQSQHLRR